MFDIENPRHIRNTILGVVLFVLALTVSCGSCYTVDSTERAVVTRFGAVTDVTGPGLHSKAPFVDSVTKINTTAQTINWEHDGKTDYSMDVYSHDQQAAKISVRLSYMMRGYVNNVITLYTKYRGDIQAYANSVLIPRTTQAIKTTFGQFTAVSVIQDREKFNREAADAVTKQLGSLNVEGEGNLVDIVTFNVTNVDFSDKYEHAVEERMVAEIEVNKVKQNLAKEEQEAKIKVVQAQAEADSNLARAKAQAESTKIQGEAEAKAIRARGDALRESPKLVELVLAEKWDGKLPTTMTPNGTVPFISVK